MLYSIKNIINTLLVTSLLLLGIYSSAFVYASETDGTVDAVNRYAWGENIGWIDFGTSEGNVHVTDDILSGYAWGEDVGWITLHCETTNSCASVSYGVTNDGEGTLDGYAWSENVGWINFAPIQGGVTIDDNGIFNGYAWGEDIGWIVFNCATTDSCAAVDFYVATDWRPESVRNATSSNEEESEDTMDNESGGGGNNGNIGRRIWESDEGNEGTFSLSTLLQRVPEVLKDTVYAAVGKLSISKDTESSGSLSSNTNATTTDSASFFRSLPNEVAVSSYVCCLALQSSWCWVIVFLILLYTVFFVVLGILHRRKQKRVRLKSTKAVVSRKRILRE